jgi:hypothetical protein
MSSALASYDQIAAAINRLTPDERARLFQDLRSKLRSEGAIPEPRLYSKEEIEQWIATDEDDMRRVLERP